jgi:hypothetical protein
MRLRFPGLGRHLARRPADAIVLVRAAWRLRRDQWLRSWPFLPLPDVKYWHFRMVTANGDRVDTLSVSSVVDAARWAVAQPVGRHS